MRSRAGPSVAMLLLLTLITAGCTNPLYPPRTPPPCGGGFESTSIAVRLVGGNTTLETVHLRSITVPSTAGNATVTTQSGLCAGPPRNQRLHADNGTVPPTDIPVRSYHEAWFVHDDGVHRLALDLPLSLLERGTGTLSLNLTGDAPQVTWTPRDDERNARSLQVRAWEVHESVQRLDFFGWGTEGPLHNRSQRVTWQVNTSWNQGVHLSYDVRANRSLHPHEVNRSALDGYVNVTLLAPNGTIARTDEVQFPGRDHLHHGPLAPGNWTVIVETRTERGQAEAMEHDVAVSFRY